MDSRERIKRGNIELVDEERLLLRCKNCGAVWRLTLNDKSPIASAWWECPNGCQSPE